MNEGILISLGYLRYFSIHVFYVCYKCS